MPLRPLRSIFRQVFTGSDVQLFSFRCIPPPYHYHPHKSFKRLPGVVRRTIISQTSPQAFQDQATVVSQALEAILCTSRLPSHVSDPGLRPDYGSPPPKGPNCGYAMQPLIAWQLMPCRPQDVIYIWCLSHPTFLLFSSPSRLLTPLEAPFTRAIHFLVEAKPFTCVILITSSSTLPNLQNGHSSHQEDGLGGRLRRREAQPCKQHRVHRRRGRRARRDVRGRRLAVREAAAVRDENGH